MIRKNVTKTIISCVSVSIFAISMIGVNLLRTGEVSADCRIASDTPCVPNPDFRVVVGEILSVSITLPDNWANGNVGDFLRNDVVLSVYSNNIAGFTASMNTKSTTDLTNKYDSNYTIPTLSSNHTREGFPVNRWGYSLSNYAAASDLSSISETSAGTSSSTYKPLVDRNSAVTILQTSSPSSGSQEIYFGAKADATKPAGIYANTVVISVVSGIISEDNPAVPDPSTDNPVKPSDDNSSDDVATYYPRDERTVYTRTDQNGSGSSATTTTTTEITHGDNTSDYIASAGHSGPHGVTENVTSYLPDGTPLATGLVISAAIAGTTGLIILFAIRRKKDDDEDEE